MRFPSIEHLMKMDGEFVLKKDDGIGVKEIVRFKQKVIFTEKDGTIRRNGEGGVVQEIERKGIVRTQPDILKKIVDINESISDPDLIIEFHIDFFKYRVEHININRNPDGTIHHVRMDVV